MGSAPARYTAQLVVMVEPATAARIKGWAVHARMSNSEMLREVFEQGLEAVDHDGGPWQIRFGRLPRKIYAAALADVRAMADRALARKRGESVGEVGEVLENSAA